MNLIQSAHPVKTNPIFSRNIGLVSRSDSLLIKTVKMAQFRSVRVASTIKMSHFYNLKLLWIFPQIIPNYFSTIQIKIYPVVQISHFCGRYPISLKYVSCIICCIKPILKPILPYYMNHTVKYNSRLFHIRGYNWTKNELQIFDRKSWFLKKFSIFPILIHRCSH